MTPIERLQAAIDKLEKSSGEEWSAWSDFDDAHHFAITAWNLGGGREVVGEVLSAADAHLIVTLHRTIDAQLDTLRLARAYFGAAITGPDTSNAFADLALAMADAILGTDS